MTIATLTTLGDDRLPARFWAKVRLSASGCWEWVGSKDRGGYGWGRTGSPTRLQQTHRMAYEALVGPIPSGLQLDHLCRVRHCVNPAHLEPVTRRENQVRGVGFVAANARKTHCHVGHELAGANLYVRPDGHRRCRACKAINQAKNWAKSKTATAGAQ